jgi:rRNA-processing protein FCF1
MEVLLDTSFVISCVRKKIDFIGQLEGLGFKVVLPREVLQELRDLRENPRESRLDRDAVDVAFQMFEANKIKKVSLGRRMEKKRVDEALINKGKEGYYIATLDNEIKRAVPNKIVIFNATKSVGIERS